MVLFMCKIYISLVIHDIIQGSAYFAMKLLPAYLFIRRQASLYETLNNTERGFYEEIL